MNTETNTVQTTGYAGAEVRTVAYDLAIDDAQVLLAKQGKTDVNGQFRGQRHGLFSAAVDAAYAVILKLEPGLYDAKMIGQMAGVKGWAARVAAERFMKAEEPARRVIATRGGRGNPGAIQVL